MKIASRFVVPSLCIVITSALFACSEVAPSGATDRAVGPDGGANGSAGPSESAPARLPACEPSSGPVHEYTSIADTEARIAGTWLLCSGSIYAPEDSAGIQLSPGKARFLQKSGDTLVVGPGAAYELDVAFVDATTTSGARSYQINFTASDGFNSYISRSSADGRFLELNEGTSGKQARYVRVPQQPKPACAITSAHAYTSIPDVTARIKGRWEICSGAISSPTDTRGLELDGASAWFLIDSGGIVRGPGWDYERTVMITDTTTLNGPGSYQINLETGAGANMYSSRISESGDVLELDEATSGNKVTYRRLP